MIEVSSLTQLAQQQPVPVDTPRAVPAVSAAPETKSSSSNTREDNSPKDAQVAKQRGLIGSLDSNVIRDDKNDLLFRVDKEYDQLIVTLLDKEGEVIRQMPTDLILRLAQRIEAIQENGQLGLDAVA